MDVFFFTASEENYIVVNCETCCTISEGREKSAIFKTANLIGAVEYSINIFFKYRNALVVLSLYAVRSR